MRRSANVVAPLLATAALALLTACKSTETERCVDEHGTVVDPKFCANLPPGAQQPIAGSPNNGGGYYTNGIFFPHYYRPYYGGYGGIGGFAGGGSFAPSAGHSYSFSGTSRGGFGSSFSEGFGGHGGGE